MIEALIKSLNTHSTHKAFCINETFYTYSQLKQLAFSIGSAIKKAGGSKSKRIAITASNAIETYASIMAVWLNGYGYVPIDRNNPASRNSLILKEAGIDLVLTSETDISGVFENNDIPFISTTGIDISNDFNPSSNAQVTDLAYILFTSGSTGVPKGVPISFLNLNTFLDSFAELPVSMGPEDRCLQMFDLSFDVSVASYLLPLLSGACVYTVPSGGIKYLNIFKLLRDHQLTFASLAPSVINFLKPYFNEIDLPYLKTCIVTAEASNANLIRAWKSLMKNGQIINLYGPTEAPIWCTGYVYDESNEKSYNEMIAIGKPFKHVKAKILNDQNKEAAIGEKGELCIGSDQLTSGYLNNAEKNKQSFFNLNETRYYRTGDLCFADGQGDIIYCGRMDYQVKIQGYRVELSEVEVLIRNHFHLNCVAAAFKNKHGGNEICIFLENYSGPTSEIQKKLPDILPYYMIPSKIKIVNEFPVNSSGKTDRIKLLQSLETSAVERQ